MKIIMNEAIYVQKNDIGFLTQTDLSIPASIFLKVFGDGKTIIDNRNRFEFVKFENENEISFFKSLDWVVDYNSIKDLDESQIIELGQEVAQQKNKIATQYNSMSSDKKRKNEHMVYECEKLDFKMYSLRDALLFKKGDLQFDLPETIVLPEEVEKNQVNVLRRVLRKLKNNK